MKADPTAPWNADWGRQPTALRTYTVRGTTHCLRTLGSTMAICGVNSRTRPVRGQVRNGERVVTCGRCVCIMLLEDRREHQR